MARPQRIALLMGQDAGFHRQVLLGIRAFASHAKQWIFHNAPPTRSVLAALKEWNPHGIIAHLSDEKLARDILKLGKPVVDTACMLKGLGIPAVDVDHAAIGQLAAKYFLARGYRNFGYFGSGLAHYAQMRDASFRETVARAGCIVHSCYVEYLPHLSDRVSWKSVNSQVQHWLRSLNKPVAVLADHDVPAHDLADMCQILHLRVPHDVAILGVDDDELECQLAFPPLSSVAIPSERIGFEAAKLLDRMLAGKRVAPGPVYLPPVRVVTRHSTNMFAIDDPTVTAALQYIRDHFTQPLKVTAIVAALGVRRRALEQKFRTLLGHSVLDEIHRVRVGHVEELLANTDLLVSKLAKRAGFSTPQRMATVFRKITGLTPGEYRRQIHVRHPE